MRQQDNSSSDIEGSAGTIVVALGGNALGTTPGEQLEAVKVTATAIVDLVAKGYRVVVGHGNGPQVGVINLAFSSGHRDDPAIPAMPFAESNAMSQGYIGYHIQQSIGDEARNRGMKVRTATVVTQVEVDAEDPAFRNPTKPIGPFYSRDEAYRLSEQVGHTYVEDSGRGYRRVVPSPLPKEIVEIDTIMSLVNNGTIVVTIGGGGIPVLMTEDEGYEGVDAVIDKDNSASQLATQLGADTLLILTAVDKVFIKFGTPEQQALDTITPDQARIYLAAGEFGTGSMKPKVEACLRFLDMVPHGQAIITSLEQAANALDGKTGTIIRRETTPIT